MNRKYRSWIPVIVFWTTVSGVSWPGQTISMVGHSLVRRRDVVSSCELTGQFDFNSSTLFQRKFEVYQVAAEPLRFPRSEGDPDGHPNGSKDQRHGAEVQPEEQANHEA